MWWAAAISGWLVFAFWLVFLGPAGVLFYFRTLPRTTRRLREPAAWPRVTVIVPARDEAASIESCLHSLLASDYPHLEVIAVDDRSSDETGAIMRRVADADSRLRVLSVESLPEGWLGKNHAMHTAAAVAAGELLLFTDGDVLFDRNTIRRAVTYFTHHRLDHLCLTPSLIPGGYGERALLAYFSFVYTFGSQPWLVRSKLKLAYAGVGAFNLVRRGPFEQAGGFETLRLEVVEDVMLGKLLKWSGFRQDVLRSDGDICVRWQPSAWGVITGLEKNAFAALGYSWLQLVSITAAQAALLFWPYVALCVFADARAYGYAAALVLLHALYGLAGLGVSKGWLTFPVLPLAAATMLFAFWRSAVITLRQGGIRWRETFYPLDVLRSHRAAFLAHRGRPLATSAAPAPVPGDALD